MYKFIIIIILSFFLNNYSILSQITIDTISRKEIHHFAITPNAAYFTFNENLIFSLGLSYEYQYSRNFGIGLSASGFFNNTFEYKVEVPVSYHPYENFWISFAPGLIFTNSISYSRDFQNIPETALNDKKLTGNFVFSTVIAYDLNLNESNSVFAAAPYISTDIVNIEEFILNFGIKIKLKLITHKYIKIK